MYLNSSKLDPTYGLQRLADFRYPEAEAINFHTNRLYPQFERYVTAGEDGLRS